MKRVAAILACVLLLAAGCAATKETLKQETRLCVTCPNGRMLCKDDNVPADFPDEKFIEYCCEPVYSLFFDLDGDKAPDLEIAGVYQHGTWRADIYLVLDMGKKWTLALVENVDGKAEIVWMNRSCPECWRDLVREVVRRQNSAGQKF